MTEKISKQEWEEFQNFKKQKQKSSPQRSEPVEVSLDIEEEAREIEQSENDDDANYCAECENKIVGKPESCPHCGVALDWSEE